MSVSGQYLAKRFGVDLRTIQRWAVNGHINRDGTDEYDLDSADLFFIERLQDELERYRKSDASSGENLQNRYLLAQCRKLEAEAAVKELELERAKGLLIEIKDVESTLSHVLTTVRSRIVAIPARVAAQVSGMSEPKAI
ncbi:MAG: terminase small subunit, partial [Synechocystis sp.]|nr:terminase small subunit [Synechocystis sp.]